MTRSQEQLLELTRCALWRTEPDMSLFEGGINWMEVLHLAKEQTLQGVISTAIEMLPPSLRPSRDVALRQHQLVTINRQYRGHHVEVLRQLLELLHRIGVQRPVLLKGLGVGLNYPDSALRQCGDIDLYVGAENYFKVWEFIRSELGLAHNESHSQHHFDFEFMGTSIEIHRYATSPDSIAFRRREFMQWSAEQLEGDDLRHVSIDGVMVYLPPYNFDSIFIFYHAWRHFLMGGVGLRQLCDWSCYITTFAREIDEQEVKRLIALFRLEKPISLFATIAVRALGVDKKMLWGYATSEELLLEGAMDRVWSRGNFGYYNVDLQRRKRGFFVRKILGSVAKMRDMCYLMTIDWRYSLRFYYLSFGESIRTALKGR